MNVRTAATPCGLQAARNSSTLSRGLEHAMRLTFGEHAVTSMRDARVAKLRGYTIEGWEQTAWDDLAQHLGKKWKQPNKAELRFMLGPEAGAKQTMTIDMAARSMTLTSEVQGCGHYVGEELTLHADGRVTRARPC